MTKLKFNKKLALGIVAVLCVIILVGSFLLDREPETEFVPEYQETITQTDSWDEHEENPTATIITEPDTSFVEGSATDQTQTVIYEDEHETVTDLSNSVPKSETLEYKPSETPPATGDNTNPEETPSYEPEKPAPEESSNSQPSGGDGMVYDPVFGWIQTGDTYQDNVDNDGDINKQIGNMGD